MAKGKTGSESKGAGKGDTGSRQTAIERKVEAANRAIAEARASGRRSGPAPF